MNENLKILKIYYFILLKERVSALPWKNQGG
jgi:hypothetical protein